MTGAQKIKSLFIYFFFKVFRILHVLLFYNLQEKNSFWWKLWEREENENENFHSPLNIADQDGQSLLQQQPRKEFVKEKLKPFVVELLQNVHGKNDYDFIEPHVLKTYEIKDEIGVGTYGKKIIVFLFKIRRGNYPNIPPRGSLWEGELFHFLSLYLSY